MRDREKPVHTTAFRGGGLANHSEGGHARWSKSLVQPATYGRDDVEVQDIYVFQYFPRRHEFAIVTPVFSMTIAYKQGGIGI